jgi:hypothetical protein
MNYVDQSGSGIDMHFDTCPNSGFLCRPGGTQNEAFPANSGIVTVKTITCPDPTRSGVVVTLVATPTVFQGTEETGFNISILTPGYVFAAVYMKAGTGGNKYVANTLSITAAANFLTPSNKGISHIDVCLFRPNTA